VRPRVAAVVCAFNEAATIARVVAALRGAGDALSEVLVVDDGSRDATAAEATRAGARVLRLSPNGGKGAAMRAGIAATAADAVFFCDADLLGLTPDHVRTLCDAYAQGAGEMVVALRDHGPAYNRIQALLPLISGERIVAKRVLAAVDPGDWRGYRIEVGINDAARRVGAKIAIRLLCGLKTRAKWEKGGDPAKGIEQAARMLVEVLAAERDAAQRR
jgi:glycosyltransferase involved in cell wall biosynthesis